MEKKKLAKISLWVALVLIVGFGGYSAVRAYQAPLAPAMDVPTATVAAPVARTDLAQPMATQPTATPVEDKTCGQTGSMTILFLGSDSSQGNPPYGADSIRLIKVNYDTQRITGITFPRDLIVQTAALNNPGIPEAPLGITFKYANESATGTEIEKNSSAASTIAETLMDNFAVRPDHYIIVQMNQFAAMIDTIGGVEITVPETITTERGVTFAAGVNTLDGTLATEYVRAIKPGGDSSRIIRQNNFLNALLEKIVSASVIPHMPKLIDQFQDALSTDLSPEQIASLTCLSGKVSSASITFDAVNTPDLVMGDIPNVDVIKAFLTEKLGQ